MKEPEEGHPPGLEALCWAAGLREEAPIEAGLDPGHLCDLLVRHRLAGRFLRQVKREWVPSWCTPALLQAMRAQRAAALANFERQAEALRELRSALPPKYRPLVIKGITTYGLTGDRAGLRYSGDIDLLCPEVEALRSALETLGYAGAFDYEWRHELGSFRRGDVAMEVHRYFPVYAYPPGMQDLDLTPERNPGIWLQKFPAPGRRAIRFADLQPHLAPSRAPELEDLRIPRPEMAALILCAHEFKEYLQSPFLLALPVRLGLLAEIRDLFRLPDFDAGCFGELVWEFGAGDAVDLVRRLLGRLCGEDPLSGTGPVPGRPRRGYPRCLGFRGAWADLGAPETALLAPEPMGLLERVGWSTLRVEPAEGPWCRGPVPPAPGGLDRLLVHASDGDFNLPALCVWREEGGLRLALRLQRLPRPEQEYRLRLDGEGPGECFSVELSEGSEEPRAAGPGYAVVMQGAHGYELRIRVAWPSLTPLLRTGSPARLFLTLMRRDARVLSYYNADAVITIPLCLTG